MRCRIPYSQWKVNEILCWAKENRTEEKKKKKRTMPPILAMARARSFSVTVSIAALMMPHLEGVCT